MKLKLFLLLSVFFVFNCYGGWAIITDDIDGNSYYIDTNSINKRDGFVYYWELVDYVEKNQSGDMSDKAYYQGSCEQSRVKLLSVTYYNKPMANGAQKKHIPSNPIWDFPLYESSVGGYLLNFVCNWVK